MKTLFLILCFFTAALAASDVVPDTSCVHPLKVFGKNGYDTATAFFIGTHRLLTAAHTFKYGSKPVILVDGKEIPCRLIKLDFSENVDCALLETDYSSPTVCQISSGITLVGYPDAKGALKLSDAGAMTRALKTDNLIVPGMSGGPLFVNGVVIGMGTRDSWFKGHRCTAIPAGVLQKFLDGTD